MRTPRGAYAHTPHKTIEEMANDAAMRTKHGELACDVIQDIVDGYDLGWQSASHRIIEQAGEQP
jgi:hypothetical protein